MVGNLVKIANAIDKFIQGWRFEGEIGKFMEERSYRICEGCFVVNSRCLSCQCIAVIRKYSIIDSMHF